MYECPHCREQSISTWQKLNAGRLFPAKCKICHGRSYIPLNYLTVWMIVWTTLLGVAWFPFLYLGLWAAASYVLFTGTLGIILLAKKAPLEGLV